MAKRKAVLEASRRSSRSMRAAPALLAAVAGSAPAVASAGALKAPAVPLLDLSGPDLVQAVILRRPSARNKSPYVGDIQLPDGREAIAHMPSMDMGGKCTAGTACVLRVARDKKGVAVGADAVGQYGTPKCEFILQLIRVQEPENSALGGVWVGAHPSIGERIAAALLERGVLAPSLGAATKIEKEVTGVAGTDMRCDFLLSHGGTEGGKVCASAMETDVHAD